MGIVSFFLKGPFGFDKDLGGWPLSLSLFFFSSHFCKASSETLGCPFGSFFLYLHLSISIPVLCYYSVGRKTQRNTM